MNFSVDCVQIVHRHVAIFLKDYLFKNEEGGRERGEKKKRSVGSFLKWPHLPELETAISSQDSIWDSDVGNKTQALSCRPLPRRKQSAESEAV